MTNIKDLEKLNAAVEFLINQQTFEDTVEQLNEEISLSHEPFVWSTIDLNSIDRELPDSIRSCWVFVLRKDVPSGCHYHPNSVQHMVAIRGNGMSNVGGVSKRLIKFGSRADSLLDVWHVIDKGVPHEFFPEQQNMVVVSFHTCEAEELEEVACDTGEMRLYEGGTH